MELSALTQFISNVAMALDAGYDLPLEETRGHVERGDFIRCLTDLCGADADLVGHLFREHWTAATERELVELLRHVSKDGRLAGSFQRSGLCYLIAMAAKAAIRPE
jgi:hypothetical protein